MTSQHNSPNPVADKDLPGNGPSKEGKSKAQIRAENRERQEKQRAAKAAAATNKSTGGGGTESNKKATDTKPKQKQPMSQRLDDLGGRRGAPSQAPTAEAAPSITTDVENKIRDLRIFSHFGARGHLGQKIKGEIHPSIIRLGLLFAEYKITGANARCISALTAFKSVSNTCRTYSRLSESMTHR
jgi:translation initiation factor eIF-2B subunit delta